MSYLDTCDRCLTEDSPAISPVDITPSGPGGVLATYICPTCRDTWTCGWVEQPAEDAA